MSRYGIREICDVTFKALTSVDIGNQHFDQGQPVLILDTAKTSSLEGAASTVYAQGGRGNPRLIGWDGEKTLTFTVEDALISAESFAMLSGAGVVKGKNSTNTDAGQKIYMHTTYDLLVEQEGTGTSAKKVAKLTNDIRDGAKLVRAKEAPVYAIVLDNAGAPKTFLSAIGDSEIVVTKADGTPETKAFDTNGILVDTVANSDAIIKFILDDEPTSTTYTDSNAELLRVGDTVRIDCYTVHTEGATELQIDADSFAGYYYIEADTLFREESTGRDLPAQFVIPRGKIQSNFTFTMANSGDPSTFTFTIDCFPAYTKFNKTKKVMATLQVLDAQEYKHNYSNKNITGHVDRTDDDEWKEGYGDSIWDTEENSNTSGGGASGGGSTPSGGGTSGGGN